MESTVGPGLSRRQMLAGAGMAGIAAAMPALRRLQVPYPFRSGGGTGPTGPADELTLGRFAPHVGSRFTVRAGTLMAVALTLEEAREIAPHPTDRAGVQGESFALVFRGSGGLALEDRIYRVTHPSLATFPLFMSAFGLGRKGQAYQAVVDRRVATR